jgi:hypothetical protein
VAGFAEGKQISRRGYRRYYPKGIMQDSPRLPRRAATLGQRSTRTPFYPERVAQGAASIPTVSFVKCHPVFFRYLPKFVLTC